MIIICEHCGCVFQAKPSAIARGKKYCSKRCYDEAQFKGIIKSCGNCGKQIKISPSLVKNNNFCCNDCRLEWLSGHIKYNVNILGHTKGHKAPHLTALNRERNPKLALEPDAVRRGDYKDAEHRKIMEKVLGRKLKPYEDVHHINGVHNDNRSENLMVLNHREHLRLHWKVAKEKGVI